MEPTTTQKKIRKCEGVVVSDAMQKTRVVEVTRLKKHPKYAKYFRVTKKFKAHDEHNQYHKGDRVVLRETRPLSREKRWEIIGVVEKKAREQSNDVS
jgi:small subunit ribosomal protein S17